MIININKQNFKTDIEQSTKPVIIEAYAVWCGPCQHMTPIFEELERELGSKYTFAKLNVDEARDIAIQYSITSVPTFLFLKNNQVQGKEIGFMSKEDLKDKISELLG
jgi:thioredoxin 1